MEIHIKTYKKLLSMLISFGVIHHAKWPSYIGVGDAGNWMLKRMC